MIAGFATYVLTLLVYVAVYFVAFPVENPDPGRTYFNLFAIPLVLVITLFFPLSFAVAILRYRLWDIDNFINRALVYGVLTAALAGIYIGGVVLLQVAFRGVTGQGTITHPHTQRIRVRISVCPCATTGSLQEDL